MGGSALQIAMYVVGAVVVGIIAGWFIRGAISKTRFGQQVDPLIGQVPGEGQEKLKAVTRQRDQLATEYSKTRPTIEALQAALVKSRSDLEIVLKKAKLLAKSVFVLRDEREQTKVNVNTIQKALVSVNKRTAALQTEFIKVGEFYKGELLKSFQKRKALEEKVEKAESQRGSVSKFPESSVSGHDSADKMTATTKIRLAQLSALERSYEKLEAENTNLSNEAIRVKQRNEALKGDVAELDELRIHNRQLVQGVESLEESRKQHEDDAEKYRDDAEQSEQLSDTLRLQLHDIQKNFADIEEQQHKTLKDARNGAVVPILSAKKSKPKEVDDLQEIVGVGRVFEKRLNDLGIFSFRQIAEFNVGDVARVNREIKELKGRIEQDDWIGQAKDLQLLKYGVTN